MSIRASGSTRYRATMTLGSHLGRFSWVGYESCDSSRRGPGMGGPVRLSPHPALLGLDTTAPPTETRGEPDGCCP